MLQGLEPPVNRTEEDFDAAAKYHISANVEYARWAKSTKTQFTYVEWMVLIVDIYFKVVERRW